MILHVCFTCLLYPTTYLGPFTITAAVREGLLITLSHTHTHTHTHTNSLTHPHLHTHTQTCSLTQQCAVSESPFTSLSPSLLEPHPLTILTLHTLHSSPSLWPPSLHIWSEPHAHTHLSHTDHTHTHTHTHTSANTDQTTHLSQYRPDHTHLSRYRPDQTTHR